MVITFTIVFSSSINSQTSISEDEINAYRYHSYTNKRKIRREVNPRTGGIYLGIEGSLGIPAGKLIDHEYNSFELEVIYPDGTSLYSRLSHLFFNYGINLHIFTSPFLGLQFGINHNIIWQEASVGGDEDYREVEYGEVLLNYFKLPVGIIVNALIINRFVWFFDIRVGYLAGKIFPYRIWWEVEEGGGGPEYKFSGVTTALGTGCRIYFLNFYLGLSFLVYADWIYCHEGIYGHRPESYMIRNYNLSISVGMRLNFYNLK